MIIFITNCIHEIVLSIKTNHRNREQERIANFIANSVNKNLDELITTLAIVFLVELDLSKI